MNAFIVDGVRTPIGSFGGSLSPIRTDDLAALSIRALLERHASLDPRCIGDVLCSGVPIRRARTIEMSRAWRALLAGLPPDSPR